MKIGVALLAALIVAGTATATASTTPTPWTRANMTAAVKAVGYPKAHAKKLTCRGIGLADSSGRYNAFRCTAAYRHHRIRRFYAAGRGEGGWLCAAATLSGCKLLRHGYITTATMNLGGAIDIAARGYMTNHYGSYQVAGFCRGGPPVWTCPFTNTTVTITTKAAKGGWVTTGTG